MGVRQQLVNTKGRNCAPNCLSIHLPNVFLFGAKGDFAQQSTGQTEAKAAASGQDARDLLAVGDGAKWLGRVAMLVGAGVILYRLATNSKIVCPVAGILVAASFWPCLIPVSNGTNH